MQLSEAIQLINLADLEASGPAVWADLGCGDGIFTRALATLLPEGSMIYGIDQSFHRIETDPGRKTTIFFHQADFLNDELPVSELHGIIMANALHYVRDKYALLMRLKNYFQSAEKYIIVEYDTMKANPWIPYPVDFQHLAELFREAGLNRIIRLGEKRSIYRREKIYAALIER